MAGCHACEPLVTWSPRRFASAVRSHHIPSTRSDAAERATPTPEKARPHLELLALKYLVARRGHHVRSYSKDAGSKHLH